MNQNQEFDGNNPIAPKKSRLTIGFLNYGLRHKNQYAAWRGMVDTARERDINLITFVGRWIHSPRAFERQAAIIYELVGPDTLDGIVLWSEIILLGFQPEEKRAFIERYRPLPVVTLEGYMAGLPDLYVDSFENMRKLMIHLIKEHHYHRIAFVRGPADHFPAQERYRAYVETLAEYGLPFDPDLVTPPGDWFEGAKERLVALLDQQQGKVDAIIGANDDLALVAMAELQARGLRVPEDVAVVGYDDAVQSRWMMPPLTTVPIDTYKWGQQAIAMALDMIEGKAVPERVIIPTELAVRRSCGCIDPIVSQATATDVAESDGSLEFINLEAAVAARREDILAEIERAIQNEKTGIEPGQIIKLLDTLVSDLNNQLDNNFLLTLDTILRQLVMAQGEIVGWQRVLSVLRRQIIPCIRSHETLSRAEDIWQQARVLVGKIAQLAQGYQTVQAEKQLDVLSQFGVDLMATASSQKLMDVLVQELQRLGLPGVYLSLYEDPQRPTSNARLIMAYNEQGRLELNQEGQIFPARQVVPAGLLSPARQHNLVVMSLYGREQQLGFIVFETGPGSGLVYESLREQISSALQSVLLIEEQKQARAAIARRVTELELVGQVSAAASTFLDVTELLQRVSDLTKASFGLYHAHIYLLNEAGDTLLLAAGAGDVGRQMMAKKWQIPLSQERSLVARAARTRRGDIVNDTRSDPAWLPNSLLPETRSELAVPLIAGERVIGVLDVQANTPHYFRDDDIRVQSTLAAQVTVALENARLFEETQSTLAETANLYQVSRRIIETNDLQAVMMALAEAGDVTDINTVVLGFLERDTDGKLAALRVGASWHSGEGTPPPANDTRLLAAELPYFGLLVGAEPIFIDDVLHDDRVDLEMLSAMQGSHIQSLALLPLWVSTRQVGVLLLLAEKVHPFTKRERRLYASSAGQVAVFVENQRLLAESRAVSAELETTQRRYTIQAWESYRARHTALSYEYQRDNLAPADDNALAEMATEEDGGVLAESTANLVVPLTVRGEVIGVLGLQETEPSRQWLPAERTLVEAIAQQVAQAAENLRLIDETQQRAARERRAAEIGDKIRGTQSLEEALQVAVKEIGLSLKTPQTTVRLQILDEV